MDTMLASALQIRVEPDAAPPPWLGMRALMLAVLEEAIHSSGSSVGHVRAAAVRWIVSPEHRYVFSFVVICETLGLEPSAVRRSIMRLVDKKRTSRRVLPRSRPYVRRAQTIQLAPARGHAA
jgi:hypothetical protein